MCFTCRGGFGRAVLLTNLAGGMRWGVSAKEKISRAWGQGAGLRFWDAHLYVFTVGEVFGGDMF